MPENVYSCPVERSRSGLPCLWEEGGGQTNTGRATVIAASDGSRKRALYVRRSGSLACGEHALIPVAVGDWIIDAAHSRGDYTVFVSRIARIAGEVAQCTLEYSFGDGEWDQEPLESLAPAIDAAREKAQHYHCREPHYALVPVERRPVPATE